MKFRRTFRGRGRNTYVIRPGLKFIENGMTQYRYPLRVEFEKGYFDSEHIAELQGWSKEERELVEQTLMRHADFGHGLFLDESHGPVAYPGTPVANEPGSLTLEENAPHTICIASVETDGATRLCGKQTVEPGGEFCADHIEVFAETGA